MGTQQWLAAPMLLGGGWCLFAPKSMLKIFCEEPARTAAGESKMTQLFTRYLGTQLMSVGALVATAKMTKEAYQAWALCLLPVAVLDLHYSIQDPILGRSAWADALGCLGFIGYFLYVGLGGGGSSGGCCNSGPKHT